MTERELRALQAMRAAVVKEERAPEACIVCNAKPTHGDGREWFYLAGSVPAGAMACKAECLTIALERSRKSGRVDR